MLVGVDSALLASGAMQPGQQVVLVCGYPVGAKRAPNMALLHTVGSDATVNLARNLAEGNVRKK
jgi:pyruvate kinase